MKRKSNSVHSATMAGLGERGLISWILPQLQARGRGRFLVPPGDDAAILSSIGKPVLSIDGLSESTHFKMSWETKIRKNGFSLARGLGWKLLGSSLSDLAAMGDVQNRWAMIFVGAPSSVKGEFLKEFFRGLVETAAPHKCALAGGDTIQSPTLTLAAAVGGTLQSKPLTRSGAKPGDLIGIAGTVGDAARGLEALQGKIKLSSSSRKYFIRRFFDAAPMFTHGRKLAHTKGVTSLMDLSDSLPESLDLMLPPKKLGFSVDLDIIPRSSIYGREFSQDPKHISGGEDYSLLFTVSPQARKIFDRSGFHQIGTVVSRSQGRRSFANGREFKAVNPFEHFR